MDRVQGKIQQCHLLFCRFPLRNNLFDCDKVDDGSGIIKQGGDGGLFPEFSAILGPVQQFAPPGLTGGNGLPEVGVQG